ncbi:dienelactone hydrolase family protein [Actinoplanes subtropicus]|uniref:dienelactone hydrolase family protein n=1 Tax=Actinoplanes subtropicus TaxID=543632 RepID=UPI0004C46A57|nr:dienelactone hydrolase family protein [Actinoplanes subtropicus]
MTRVALFHSVYGLRPAVVAAARFLRAAGHDVVTPDLYAGYVARSIEEGFTFSDRIGWATIMQRAREAVRDQPDDTVLAGLSMGAGVAGGLLAERPGTRGVMLLHGTGGDPRSVRGGLPVQLHVGQADAMFPPAEVAAWHDAMAAAGAVVELLVYPHAEHFFTDPDVPDYDQAAATLLWQRARSFLDAL